MVLTDCFIFFDFETSTRELLGQIVEYAFVVIDSHGIEQATLSGLIQPRRTELPDPEALMVSGLGMEQLIADGCPEPVVADRIHQFLQQWVDQSRRTYLVGYNSNQFDVPFLRNLLITHGLDPYFRGRLYLIDGLHYLKWIATTHADTFPFHCEMPESERPYYSFSLKNMAHAFGVSAGDQTHRALDDVRWLIAVLGHSQTRWGEKLQAFTSVRIFDGFNSAMGPVGRSSYLTPEGPEWSYWITIIPGKHPIVCNLEKYAAATDCPLSSLRYINTNKHYFGVEPSTNTLIDEVASQVRANPWMKMLTADVYFSLIEKPWDIAYQIHELGFTRIPKLRASIQELMEQPDRYCEILARIQRAPQPDPTSLKKDRYFMQLFNRFYLNYHPNPPVHLMQRYLIPRYITGEMLRDPTQFQPLETLSDRIAECRNRYQSDRNRVAILDQYGAYVTTWRDQYGL